MRAVLVAFAVVTISFALLHLTPGDPVTAIAGENASAERIELLRKELGLDKPLIEQYVSYMAGILTGDLGRSIISFQPVTTIIAATIPVTIWLVATTLTLAIILSIPVGIAGAILRNTRFARGLRVVTSVMLAIPAFYTGLILDSHLRCPPAHRARGRL